MAMRVQHRILPVRGDLQLVGHLAMSHHHADLAAEVLFVVAERLGALAGEIDVRVQFHRRSP
jgi:hypothetical protein